MAEEEFAEYLRWVEAARVRVRARPARTRAEPPGFAGLPKVPLTEPVEA